MAALQPVGLSGGLVKVEALGGLLASGQFPVGKLSAPQERWLVGSSSSTVVGQVLPLWILEDFLLVDVLGVFLVLAGLIG